MRKRMVTLTRNRSKAKAKMLAQKMVRVTNQMTSMLRLIKMSSKHYKEIKNQIGNASEII